jgi:hypothetical protein
MGGYKFWAGRYNKAYNPGTSWISDGSKLYATTANADISLIMYYSYGPELPFLGDWSKCQVIRKVADAAMAAADVWDESWSTTLKGVSPGLDPDKEYVIRGGGGEAAATDKVGIATRFYLQHQGEKLICPAGMDMGRFLNVFLWDGIPMMGGDGVTSDYIGGVTDTPYSWILVEEYPGAMEYARGGPSRPGGARPEPTGIFRTTTPAQTFKTGIFGQKGFAQPSGIEDINPVFLSGMGGSGSIFSLGGGNIEGITTPTYTGGVTALQKPGSATGGTLSTGGISGGLTFGTKTSPFR